MNKKALSISNTDKDFPALLKEIPNSPPQIFLLGEKSLLNGRACVAIVGTRKASSQGKIIAKRISRELAERGVVVVSGLAMGIDTVAHEGALEASGGTIAVLANGLDKIYPAQNENLAKNILSAGGAIISEYPEGSPSYPVQFLERNRIVSGLCAATVVIEAPSRSGALVTARLAAEQGREVFVFPGPVDHANYVGSHKLIRDGAKLVSSLEDILEDLGIEIKKPEKNPTRFGCEKNVADDLLLDAKQKEILKAISGAGRPLAIDKILQITNLEPQEANESVAYLIISGMIKETDRGYTI